MWLLPSGKQLGDDAKCLQAIQWQELGRKTWAHHYIMVPILDSCIQTGLYLWANDVCDVIKVYLALEIVSGLVLNYLVNSDYGLFECIPSVFCKKQKKYSCQVTDTLEQKENKRLMLLNMTCQLPNQIIFNENNNNNYIFKTLQEKLQCLIFHKKMFFNIFNGRQKIIIWHIWENILTSKLYLGLLGGKEK